MPFIVLFRQRPPASVGQPHFPWFHSPTVHPGSPPDVPASSVCDVADTGQGAWPGGIRAPRARGSVHRARFRCARFPTLLVPVPGSSDPFRSCVSPSAGMALNERELPRMRLRLRLSDSVRELPKACPAMIFRADRDVIGCCAAPFRYPARTIRLPRVGPGRPCVNGEAVAISSHGRAPRPREPDYARDPGRRAPALTVTPVMLAAR